MTFFLNDKIRAKLYNDKNEMIGEDDLRYEMWQMDN